MSRSPLRVSVLIGQGFFAAFAVVLALLMLVGTAQAHHRIGHDSSKPSPSPSPSPSESSADPQLVNVQFGFHVAGDASTSPACPLTVPLDADAATVLDAARQAGCIDSFELASEEYWYGTIVYVRCVNGMCNRDSILHGMHWVQRSLLSAERDISSWSATEGARLRLAFAPYACVPLISYWHCVYYPPV